MCLIRKKRKKNRSGSNCSEEKPFSENLPIPGATVNLERFARLWIKTVFTPSKSHGNTEVLVMRQGLGFSL